MPIGSIRNVDSQPITGYEHYHIVAIQLGPTEASRYFVYWVPAQVCSFLRFLKSTLESLIGFFSFQYVDAIKDALSN